MTGGATVVFLSSGFPTLPVDFPTFTNKTKKESAKSVA